MSSKCRSVNNRPFRNCRSHCSMGPSYFPGDVLITVATGFISDAEAERAGLVQTHAYAVLDIRKIQV